MVVLKVVFLGNHDLFSEEILLIHIKEYLKRTSLKVFNASFVNLDISIPAEIKPLSTRIFLN